MISAMHINTKFYPTQRNATFTTRQGPRWLIPPVILLFLNPSQGTQKKYFAKLYNVYNSTVLFFGVFAFP